MDAEMVDVTGDDESPVTNSPMRGGPAPGAKPPVGSGPTATAPAGPEPSSGATPADDEGEPGDAVEHDIAALLTERDQFKDIALRLQADFENYRKRSQALQADEVDRATGKLVEALLPVLDACEAGYAHGYEGVEQIWSVLLTTLQKEGLEPLDLSGQPFDPNVADAVMHEEGDGGEPVVTEVLRTGYRWKGKVLRAAMVKVKG